MAGGGLGYRILFAPQGATQDFQKYDEEKRQGLVYNAEVAYNFDGQLIGIRYITFRNSISVNNYEIDDGNRVDKSEDIQINYYGLQYHNQYQIKESRYYFSFTVGAGIIRYYSDGKVDTYKLNISGKTYGLTGGAELEYRISRRFAFASEFILFTAKITDVKQNGDDIKLKNAESLTHCDINACLKLYF